MSRPRWSVPSQWAALGGASVAAAVTAQVNATLKLMTWIKIKIAAVSGAAVLLAATVPIVHSFIFARFVWPC